MSTAERDVYARLGVRRLINAYETVSNIGATRMHPEVAAAMHAARDAFVDLRELHAAVGRRLAELTHNEAAVVTNGASAGMVLATIACAAHRDAAFVHRLTAPPRAQPLPTVVVQRVHMSPYVQNVQQAGVTLVEVGYTQNRTPVAHLEAAFDERTVAVLYTAGRPYEHDGVPLETVAEVAHAHGVPVVVDAAALVPPAENLWRFVERGADLAVFSGGKGLQGPQDAGLVVGRADLIAIIHAVNAPIHGLGRPFKMAKEDVIGMLVAVERALADDEDARYGRLQARAERVAAGLRGVAGLDVFLVPDGRQGQPCPRTVMRLLPATGWARDAIIEALRVAGVVVGPYEGAPDGIAIHPLGLTDAEADEVVEAVRGLVVGVPAPRG